MLASIPVTPKAPSLLAIFYCRVQQRENSNEALPTDLGDPGHVLG